MERVQLGGRKAAGFGVGLTPNEALEELEKSDPCRACHHDAYTKLKTFGSVLAGMVVGAGLYRLFVKEKR
jgi:hypothetical protein